MKKPFAALALIIPASMLFTACIASPLQAAPQPLASPSPAQHIAGTATPASPKASPSPSAQKVSFYEKDGASGFIADEFLKAAQPDLSVVNDIEPCIQGDRQTYMKDNRDIFETILSVSLPDSFDNAADELEKKLTALEPGVTPIVNVDYNPVDLNYMGIITDMLGYDPDAISGALYEMYDVASDIRLEDGAAHIMFSINPRHFSDCVGALSKGDSQFYMSAKSGYAYLNTVYDGDYEPADYVLPEPEGNLENLTYPLPGHPGRKTWYADRDRGRRRHTGLDIHAPEGAEILACAGGTVLFVDYNDMCGNFVVIRDDYGYDYQYMHMVELSRHVKQGDKVSAGDVIGNVGNTGNSDVNHLHLTIITDDDYLINPYAYLQNW